MTRATIFWVEDDSSLRGMLRDLLEAKGYQVAEAADGRDAVERLLAGPPPSLVLTDLCMLRTNGWDLCAAMARPAGSRGCRSWP